MSEFRIQYVVAAVFCAALLGWQAQALAQSEAGGERLSQGAAGEATERAGAGNRRRKSGSSSKSRRKNSPRRTNRTNRKTKKSDTTKRSKKKRSARKKRSREVTVPVEVSAGPSFFFFGNPFVGDGLLSGPIYDDQPVHYGIRLGVAAIIDYEFVRNNRRLVPKKYRGMFKKDTEVRFKPAVLALIPRNLYLSPQTRNTGIYGATWELLHVGMSLLRTSSSRLSVGAGLLATYAYIDSDAFDSPTHFIRPGLGIGLEFGTMLTDAVGVSAGAGSNFYLPQNIGGSVTAGDDDDALWHIGEAFLMLHYRFPYTHQL